MQLETMFITRDGPIATLHLNRTTRLNAFGNQGTIDLNIAADTLARDDTARIVIITGEGRAFSTGIDLKELSAGEIDMSYHHRWEGGLRKFEAMNKVVISAINGYCLGGGLQLALACDIRIAVESAQLGLPAVKEGLIPGMGVWRLPRFVGLGRAKQLILSGQLLGARAAQAIGMVDEVVADSDLATSMQTAAEHYLHIPWAAVLLSKRMTNLAFDLPFDDFLPQYFAAQTEAMRSADHLAALRAYREEQAQKRRQG
ncbi:MAG TPA: enoyl-CoA hydratase/isomerase family protein [Roseiflexaceae bacterium]